MTAPAELMPLQTRDHQQTSLVWMNNYAKKQAKKLNKMAELLKIIFTASNQTFQLPPH